MAADKALSGADPAGADPDRRARGCALKRAARIGDGWISAGTSLEELDGYLKKLHAFRAEFGRDKEPFEVQNMGASAYTPDGIKQLEDRGVDEVIVAFRNVYNKDPDTSLEEKLGHDALVRGQRDRKDPLKRLSRKSVDR
jgi:alkanesulfonate monooxygenase SsuD/methylene tetrahydromethanopterin reductase-like flavin-dependent oxidoreductase (luciferase family)